MPGLNGLGLGKGSIVGRRGSDRNIDASTARPLPPSYNRRIGARAAITPIPINWLPALPRKHFHRAEKPRPAVIEELSVTGARVRALADPSVRIGTQVVIANDGASGVVEVRRIEAAPDAIESLYGVQFVRLDPELQQLFDRAASTDGHDDVDWRWDSAR